MQREAGAVSITLRRADLLDALLPTRPKRSVLRFISTTCWTDLQRLD